MSNSLCVSLSLGILSQLEGLLFGASSLRLSSSLPLVIGNFQGPGLPGLIYTPPSPTPPGHAGVVAGGRADGVGLSQRLVNTQLKPSSSFNDPDCWSSCMMSRPPCSSPFT